MATVSIRMDDSLKRDTEAVLSELGLNMTTAVTMFAKAIVRENGLPLNLSLDRPNSDTLEALREVELMKRDPSRGKTYSDVRDMMRELLA